MTCLYASTSLCPHIMPLTHTAKPSQNDTQREIGGPLGVDGKGDVVDAGQKLPYNSVARFHLFK